MNSIKHVTLYTVDTHLRLLEDINHVAIKMTADNTEENRLQDLLDYSYYSI